MHRAAPGKINLEREAEVWRATLASIDPRTAAPALVFGTPSGSRSPGEFDFGCTQTTAA
jgi:hypothetical protein